MGPDADERRDSREGEGRRRAPRRRRAATLQKERTLTLTQTATATDGLFSAVTSALDARLYEVIEFATVLTSAQIAPVADALATYYSI